MNRPDGPVGTPLPVNPPHRRPPIPGGFFPYPFLGFGPVFYGSPFSYFPFMGYPGFSSYTGYPGYSSYTGYSVAPSSSYPPDEQPYSEVAPTVGPQSSYVLPDVEQPSQQPAESTPEATSVALLAFKDHSIVAVTDYWMEGETVYYETSYGGRTGIPLGQLDLSFTQQLNRERNLRFVLEFRP